MCVRDVSLKFSKYASKNGQTLNTAWNRCLFLDLNREELFFFFWEIDRCFSCRQRVNGQCQRLAHSILDARVRGVRERRRETSWTSENDSSLHADHRLLIASSAGRCSGVRGSVSPTSDCCGESRRHLLSIRQALRIFVCPKRKSDGWRSEQTEQTAEIVLRCATSRLEDRRCGKVNSCRKIGQTTRKKIVDFDERPREKQSPRSLKRNWIHSSGHWRRTNSSIATNSWKTIPIDTFRLNVSLDDWIRRRKRSRGNLSSIHWSAHREKERSFPLDEIDQVTSKSTENQFGFRCLNRVFVRSMREDQWFIEGNAQ